MLTSHYMKYLIIQAVLTKQEKEERCTNLNKSMARKWFIVFIFVLGHIQHKYSNRYNSDTLHPVLNQVGLHILFNSHKVKYR